jgi:CRISPR-associated endonuclease/helicase Cas3
MWLAHSAPPKAAEKGPQPYRSHVENVRAGAVARAKRLLSFAVGEGAAQASTILEAVSFAAEYHDIGKLDDENQAPLTSGRGGRLAWDHIDAGVAHSLNCGNVCAAWIIRAHHAPGLSSAPNERFQEHGALRGKRDRGEAGRHLHPGFHKELVERTERFLTTYLLRHQESGANGHSAEHLPEIHGLTLRLLLSCIVDADHTDTAAWDGAKEVPSAPPVKWNEVIRSLDSYVADLSGDRTDEKTRLRSALYEAAVSTRFPNARISTCEAGVGLGKTTSVIRNLLNDAEEEKLRHLFVVAPYTNILRQSANVLRSALGDRGNDELIAENHHRAEFTDISSRQYSALWRAPITLTTAVQFFETLASNHPGQLRKLHELPGSMIFLDEAHAALPAAFWPQAWKWLKELVDRWGCRVMLSSGSMVRFWETVEIIEPIEKLEELTPLTVVAENRVLESRRVEISAIETALNCGQIVDRLAGHLHRGEGPVLAILNTVQSATAVARVLAQKCDHIEPLDPSERLPLVDRKILHLSTALSPFDREKILLEIVRRDAAHRLDWILVATSCVEAGIDLDFQIGYRERCSVAALIQTSGRINRHSLRSRASLFDFQIIEDGTLTRHPAFSLSSGIVRRLWRRIIAGESEPASLVTLAMEMEIAATGGIAESVVKNESARDYPAVAKDFQIIQTDTRTVVVNSSLKERLMRREPVRSSEIILHSVQLWAEKIRELAMEPIFPGSDLYQWSGPYDPNLLGIMRGIFPILQLKQSGTLLIGNIQ